jgi:hypothetical protein
MVAVRLARGWVGYGGMVHRPGELVDVDAVTLARLEASGVVTPSESVDPWAAQPGQPDDDERTVAWSPADEDERTVAWSPADDPTWAGPTGGNTGWAGPTGSDPR